MEKQGRSSPANKEDIGDLQLLTNGCLSFKGDKLSQNYWAYHWDVGWRIFCKIIPTSRFHFSPIVRDIFMLYSGLYNDQRFFSGCIKWCILHLYQSRSTNVGWPTSCFGLQICFENILNIWNKINHCYKCQQHLKTKNKIKKFVFLHLKCWSGANVKLWHTCIHMM